MLRHKQSELSYTEWISVVRRTEHQIINSPDQYFSDQPKKGILDLIVHHLFNEFLSESF